MKTMHLILSILIALTMSSCKKDKSVEKETLPQGTYTFPEESALHEGTWLQWPHHHQYGTEFRDDMEPTWVSMCKALISCEKVHIIAYDQSEKDRIIHVLGNQNIDLSNIDFYLFPTDDFWVRDNGPIFAYDEDGKLVVQDWGFNGWGNKAQYKKCNAVPTKIAQELGLPLVNLNTHMINEGGSVEVDGNGTMLACKSSILNTNRNPNMSQEEAEKLFSQFYGVSHFIWLDGTAGKDITDGHIDGFARFGNANTIVTMNREDLGYFYVKDSDIDKLYAAKNKDGQAYSFLKLPLTQNNLTGHNGQDLGKASYCNYYIANTKVLVPVYNDPNDAIALQNIQSLYPERTVVGIDCSKVYEYGGMIHCITQQQPAE